MEAKVDTSDVAPILIKTQPVKEMLSVTEVNGVKHVRINSSSLALLQECLRKSRYTLVEKWRSEVEGTATVFGSAIHKALEVFYRGEPSTRKLPSLNQMELMAYGHRVDGEDDDLLLRATRAFVTESKSLSDLPEGEKHSIPNGVWILWHYFHTYLNDPYVAHVDQHGPLVERDFTFRLFEGANIVIDYFGRIDLVVKNTETGMIYVADHKTSSVVGDDFFNRIKPNHQYTGYLMGAQKCLGLQTNEFLVNCLQVKPRPKTVRGTDPHFPRQITTRDADDFKEFTDSVVHEVVNYLASLKSGVWPLGNVNACTMYRGCQYLPVCGAPHSLRENVLASKFIKGVVSEVK